MANGYADQMRYPSPSAGQMGVPNPLMGYGQNAPTDQTYAQQQPSPAAQSNGRPAGDPGPPKAFACSTCGKGFARRSDLARHGEFQVKPLTAIFATNTRLERIHSGIRPHVCDFLNCGKMFIQRSALTVHQRVHTGEKPHMCERCGKVGDGMVSC